MTSEKSLPKAATEECIVRKENSINEYYSERNQSFANFLRKMCRRLIIHSSAQRFKRKRPGSKKSPSAIITIDTVAELKYFEAKLGNSACITQQLINQAVELFQKITRNERFYDRRKKPLVEMPALSSIGLLQNFQLSNRVEMLKKLDSLLSSVMKEKFQKEESLQRQPNGENFCRHKKLFYILKRLFLNLQSASLVKSMPFANRTILSSTLSETLTRSKDWETKS